MMMKLSTDTISNVGTITSSRRTTYVNKACPADQFPSPHAPQGGPPRRTPPTVVRSWAPGGAPPPPLRLFEKELRRIQIPWAHENPVRHRVLRHIPEVVLHHQNRRDCTYSPD